MSVVCIRPEQQIYLLNGCDRLACICKYLRLLATASLCIPQESAKEYSTPLLSGVAGASGPVNYKKKASPRPKLSDVQGSFQQMDVHNRQS